MRVILGGNCDNSSEIGQAIAERLNLPFFRVEQKTFRDTEMLIRLPVEKINPDGESKKELKGIEVLYVQSTAPKQSEHLIEMFLTIENIKSRGAKSLTLIVPYLAHARQDKEFNPGEVISNKVMGKIMKSLGVDHLITVDVHFHRDVGKYNYEGIESFNATAAEALAKYVRDEMKVKSPRIIIPDYGHKPIVEFITPLLGHDVEFGKKVRKGETDVAITFSEESLHGKPAVIFDDMVSGGTTCVKTAQYLKQKGAGKVILAVTHTLYINDARDKLLNAGIDRIVATDTIKKDDSVVRIAPVIADAIKKSGF